MIYKVEVKCFLTVNIEAGSASEAKRRGCAFVESLAPDAAAIAAWNAAEPEQAVIDAPFGFDTEDTYYLEDADGNEIQLHGNEEEEEED